jgi:hypothetical protein
MANTRTRKINQNVELNTTYDFVANDGTFSGTVTGNSFVGPLTGDVTGTVSSLSNHDTGDLDEGTNLYFTTARARAAFSAGTGVNITSGVISIGQSVSTASDVTFGSVTATTFEGALTGDVAGNADTASALEAAVNIALTGSVTGNVDFDGSGNVSITTTTNHNHDDRYYTETESDGKYLLNTTDTLDGDLTITGDLNVTGTIDLSNADLNIGAADIVFGTVTGGATRGLIWDVSGSYLSKLIGGGADGGKITLFANMDDAITTGNIFEIKDGSLGSLFLGLSHAGILTAGGGTSTQWNTAYTYSQVGHLPLTGKAADSELLDGIDGSGYLRVSPDSSTPYNGNFAIGNNGTTNFIQSHASQTLEINPLGNAVTINNQAAIHAGNIGSQSVNYATTAGSATDSTKLPLAGGTLTGVLNSSIASGTIISTGGGADAFGYHTSYGHYIQGAGDRFIYGDGYYYDGAVHRTLIHSGNIAAQSVASAGNADTLDSLDSSQFLRSDADDTMSATLKVTGDVAVGGNYNGGYYPINDGDGIDDNWGLEFQRTPGASDYNTRLKYYPVTGESRKAGIFDSASESFTLYSDSNTTPNIIIPGGRLGVGASSLGQKLVVSGESDTRVQIDSSSTQGIYFTKSTANNGTLRVNADGDYEFYTKNVAQAVVIKAGGNVGIGQTNPATKLEVNGNIKLSSTAGPTATPSYIWLGNDYSNGTTRDKCKVFLYNSGTEQYGFSVGSYADVQYHSNGYHDFYAANSLKVRINNSGNVGIGADSPGAKLEISSGATLPIIRARYNGSYYTDYDSNGIKVVGPSQTFSITDNGSTAFHIASGGNIGIGNTEASGRLDVQQNTSSAMLVRLWNTNTSGTGAMALRIANNSNNNNGGRIEFSDSNYYVATISGDRNQGIVFRTSATGQTPITIPERMRIATNGNVKIGIGTPPSELSGLTVAMDGNSYVLASNNTISTFMGSDVSGYGMVGTLTNHALAIRTNNTVRAYITQGGYVGINETNPTSPMVLSTPGNTVDGTFYSTFTIKNTGSASFSRIRFDRGSVAKWGLTHHEDDSFRISNLYKNGAVDADDNAFTIKNNSYIGIGTSSPTAKLEVGDYLDAATNSIIVAGRYEYMPQFVFRLGQSGTGLSWNGGVISCGDDGNYNGVIYFKTANIGRDAPTTKMAIKASGAVGIGTTTPMADGLSIRREGGDRRVLLKLDRPNTAGLKTAMQFTVGDIMVGQIQHEYAASNYNHMSFTLRSVGGGDIIPLWLENSGNVGFGVTSPTAKVDTGGVRIGRDFSIPGRSTVRIDSNGTGKPADILFGHTAAANEASWNGVYWSLSSRAAENGNRFTIWRGGGQPAPYNSEAILFSLEPSGALGLGVTAPAEKLDVAGTAQAYNFQCSNAGSYNVPDAFKINTDANWTFGAYSDNNTQYWMQVKYYGEGNDNRGFRLFNVNGGSATWRVNGAGTMYTVGDVVAYASDKRLKENIKPIPNAIEKVKSLSGVTFDWNEKSKEAGFIPSRQKDDVGVLAQEVQSVLPQAIDNAPFDWQDGKSKSGENYLTVKYEKIVPLLIEAIKEQQKQIEELKAIVNGITK